MMNRRDFLNTGTLAAIGTASLSRASGKALIQNFSSLPAAFTKLEKTNGGRLGIAVLDTASGESTGHRASERFPMCSTFKFLLAAAVLHRVDTGQEHLDHAITIPAKPLLGHSPLTEEHAGATMTISDLCHAILTQSDNTAANLLLTSVGGPPGLTRFARKIGDPITRLDRTEPSMNESAPGDPRDTASPDATIGNLRRLLIGNVLSTTSRDQLTRWMVANETGNERLRAGLPHAWRVGDRTGSSGIDTSNDIAIVWPIGRPPLLIAAYLTGCPGPESKRGAVLAEVGRLVAASLEAA